MPRPVCYVFAPQGTTLAASEAALAGRVSGHSLVLANADRYSGDRLGPVALVATDCPRIATLFPGVEVLPLFGVPAPQAAQHGALAPLGARCVNELAELGILTVDDVRRSDADTLCSVWGINERNLTAKLALLGIGLE